MSNFFDNVDETAYFEALEEQELYDYAMSMIQYKKQKEAEAKAIAEKEKAETLEKERKEREKKDLESKCPERNFVFDEISKLAEIEGSKSFNLEKNEVAFPAYGESNSSILLSFKIYDSSDDMFMFPYLMNCNIEFYYYENHVSLTMTQGFMKSELLMKLLGFEEPSKNISIIRSEKDLSKKYEGLIQEINKMLTIASELECIKEYISNNDVKKRLIFHFWNNATCIQNKDAEFDDTEIMKSDYIPQEYYCGRHLGLINFHQEWIDPRLYREKNSTDPEDIYAPTRNAFVKTRDEFPDIFQEYDYEDSEDN